MLYGCNAVTQNVEEEYRYYLVLSVFHAIVCPTIINALVFPYNYFLVFSTYTKINIITNFMLIESSLDGVLFIAAIKLTRYW